MPCGLDGLRGRGPRPSGRTSSTPRQKGCPVLHPADRESAPPVPPPNAVARCEFVRPLHGASVATNRQRVHSWIFLLPLQLYPYGPPKNSANCNQNAVAENKSASASQVIAAAIGAGKSCVLIYSTHLLDLFTRASG